MSYSRGRPGSPAPGLIDGHGRVQTTGAAARRPSRGLTRIDDGGRSGRRRATPDGRAAVELPPGDRTDRAGAAVETLTGRRTDTAGATAGAPPGGLETRTAGRPRDTDEGRHDAGSRPERREAGRGGSRRPHRDPRYSEIRVKACKLSRSHLFPVKNITHCYSQKLRGGLRSSLVAAWSQFRSTHTLRPEPWGCVSGPYASGSSC
jgi:hypothetical protein